MLAVSGPALGNQVTAASWEIRHHYCLLPAEQLVSGVMEVRPSGTYAAAASAVSPAVGSRHMESLAAVEKRSASRLGVAVLRLALVQVQTASTGQRCKDFAGLHHSCCQRPSLELSTTRFVRSHMGRQAHSVESGKGRGSWVLTLSKLRRGSLHPACSRAIVVSSARLLTRIGRSLIAMLQRKRPASVEALWALRISLSRLKPLGRKRSRMRRRVIA